MKQKLPHLFSTKVLPKQVGSYSCRGRPLFGKEWCLFYSVEKSGDQRSVDLHSALWTEFLATKACDAGFCVDHRNAVFHYDRSCRTNFGAFFATNTKLFDRFWGSTECGTNEHGGEFSGSLKLQAATHVNVFVVTDDKVLIISRNRKL